MAYFTSFADEAGRATFRRVTKTNKPRFSSDTGIPARLALTRAEDVFQQSTNKAGGLSYPWTSGSATVTTQDIQVDLRMAAAAITDDSFRQNVQIVQTEIENIEKWVPRTPSTYIPLTDVWEPETPQKKVARERNEARVERIQDKQMTAAAIGLTAAKAAHKRLDELSSNQ